MFYPYLEIKNGPPYIDFKGGGAYASLLGDLTLRQFCIDPNMIECVMLKRCIEMIPITVKSADRISHYTVLHYIVNVLHPWQLNSQVSEIM